MIIKYKFLSQIEGEITEVEVDEELGNAIKEIAHTERKNQRKETRRHTYISQMDPDDKHLSKECNYLEGILKWELHGKLFTAVEKLKPEQKELLLRVFVKRETQEKISESEGVSQQAISDRLKTIFKFLERNLK